MLKTMGALALISGIAQLIQLLAQPMLARLYLPSEFGELAQISSIAMFLAVLATMQFHNLLVTYKNDKVGFDKALAAALNLCISMSALLIIPIYIFREKLFYEAAGLQPVICTGLIIFAMSIGAIIKGGLIAVGDFSGLMRFTLIRAFALVTVQFIFGWAQIRNGLVLSIIISEFFSICLSAKFLIKRISMLEYIKAPSTFIRLFSDKKDYLVVGTMQELVSVAAFALPLYMFSRVYGYTFGGQFAMAHKMSWAPVMLISQSISSVLFRYISDKDKEEVRGYSVLNPLYAMTVAFLVAGIGFLVLPIIFEAAFGNQWKVSASISAWLALWTVSFLVSVPYRLLYRVYSRQYLQLLVDGIVLTIGVVIFLSGQLTAYQAVCMLSIVGVLQNLALIIISRYIILSKLADG